MVNNNLAQAIESRVFPIEANIKDCNSMMLTPESILICGKKTDDPTQFREAFDKAFGKQMTLTVTYKIDYDTVRHFQTQSDSSDGLNLKFTTRKLLHPSEITFKNGEPDRHNIMAYLEQVQGFKPIERPIPASKAILPNIFYVLLAAVVTWSFSSDAMYKEDASEFVSRKNRFFKELLIDFAQTIGQTGVLVLGCVATAVTLWFLWKKYKNPPVATVYTRS